MADTATSATGEELESQLEEMLEIEKFTPPEDFRKHALLRRSRRRTASPPPPADPHETFSAVSSITKFVVPPALSVSEQRDPDIGFGPDICFLSKKVELRPDHTRSRAGDVA
jgi:hypothetical protein